MTYFLQRLAERAMGLRSSVHSAAALHNSSPILKGSTGDQGYFSDARLSTVSPPSPSANLAERQNPSPHPEAFLQQTATLSPADVASADNRLSAPESSPHLPSANDTAQLRQSQAAPERCNFSMEEMDLGTIVSAEFPPAPPPDRRARARMVLGDRGNEPGESQWAGYRQNGRTGQQRERHASHSTEPSTALLGSDHATPVPVKAGAVFVRQTAGSPLYPDIKPLLPQSQERKDSGAMAGLFPKAGNRPGGVVEETTEVHVTIGRIDVTAVYEPALEKQRKTSLRPQPMSLDDYLTKRQGRRV